MNYRLRPATAADGDFIYSLRASGLREYVEQIWGWDEEFQAARFRQFFDSSSYQIIALDGQDVGALSVSWRDKELFLSDIEIAPEWRGRGVGTAIIRQLLTDAHDKGVPTSLQVLKVNPARHLYQRLGFQIVGETETHYLMSTVGERAGES